MQLTLCKSKIHRATVTEANLNYIGSITIDKNLMAAASIIPYEQVHVVNVNNGNRLITYAIEGSENSGVICVNGAAAHLVSPQDKVIIIAYAQYAQEELAEFSPQIVFVNEYNQIVTKMHLEEERSVYPF